MRTTPWEDEVRRRRFRAYDRVAPLLVRVVRGDGTPAACLDAARRALRRLEARPAYLTRAAQLAMRELERALQGTDAPTADDTLPAEVADAALLLHAQLARDLTSTEMLEAVDALDLSEAHALALDRKEEQAAGLARDRERRAAARRLWREGAAQLAEGNARKAARTLREALGMDPGRPALHNDLGLALAAAGDDEGAVVEYQQALRLADARPETRGPGWALSLFNLAKALRRRADVHDQAGRLDQAVRLLAEAQLAARRFVAEEPESARAEECRHLAEVLERDLARAEKSLRIVTGGKAGSRSQAAPSAPEPDAEGRAEPPPLAQGAQP